MKENQIRTIINLLREKGVSFDKGLSESEIIEIQKTFNFNFPNDLKTFLKTEMPVSDSFVHWRYGINSLKGKSEIQHRIDWPLRGILFDVKNNSFWLDEWGDIPKTFEEKKHKVETKFEFTPKLIPIYSHRYIPDNPNESGNPIFSVYQTDIIHYGFDLIDYLGHEFKLQIPNSFGKIQYPKEIEFWSKLVALNI